VQGLGQIGVVVEHLVDVVGVGVGLVLDPAAAGVPILGVALLARAQAQALAGPAKGELDAAEARFACSLREELAGDFHREAN
jgi:hypothetical protein